MKQMPNDLILILFGDSCVGKTTAAYNILKICPQFRIVSELDIVRLVARTAVTDVINKLSAAEQAKVEKEYAALFSSIRQEDFKILKQQSNILRPYVKEIIQRQQKRKIPTIIEGLSIVPSTYFNKNKPTKGFENNIVFVYLYCSDKDEHIKRRTKRCKQRKYSRTKDEIKKEIDAIRKNTEKIQKEISNLKKKNVNNVFSIDVSNMSRNETTKEIITEVENYLKQC